MKCRVTPCLWLTSVSTTAVVLWQLSLQLWLESLESKNVPVSQPLKKVHSFRDVNDVVLVWWTPFTGNEGSLLQCGHVQCYVTQDRRFRFHPKFQMFLFYGSNIEILDLPLPRKLDDIWSLLHEESPKNVPFLSHKEGISLFNYTSTFSRFSDVPLTLQYVHSIKSITDPSYFVPVKRKNELLDQLAPVLYVQSDCDTPLDRDNYIRSLMKYVPVDSYGACLQNKQLPPSMTNPMESMNSNDFLNFIARYKFTIAFENAICEDYITEKLWRSLVVGSVPIYLGSPSVKDWLPNPNSAILVSDFQSPENLSKLILEINADDEKYSSFLSHKEGIITNNHFVSEMQSRKWGLSDDSDFHFVNHFECQMCLKAHQAAAPGNKQTKMAEERDYLCPRPTSSISGQEDRSNPWWWLWQHGKCVGYVLKRLIEKGHSVVNETSFNILVDTELREGNC